MTALSSLVILAALLAVPLAWLGRERGFDLVALAAALVLTWISPLSAAWIVGLGAGLPLAMRGAERWGGRAPLALAAALAVLAAFVAAQLTPGVVWIGGAFFTLRQLHVIGEWWMGRMAAPGVRAPALPAVPARAVRRAGQPPSGVRTPVRAAALGCGGIPLRRRTRADRGFFG